MLKTVFNLWANAVELPEEVKTEEVFHIRPRKGDTLIFNWDKPTPEVVEAVQRWSTAYGVAVLFLPKDARLAQVLDASACNSPLEWHTPSTFKGIPSKKSTTIRDYGKYVRDEVGEGPKNTPGFSFKFNEYSTTVKVTNNLTGIVWHARFNPTEVNVGTVTCPLCETLLSPCHGCNGLHTLVVRK